MTKTRGLLWFVIPALNERENLPGLAQQLEPACTSLGEDFHVVLVDDGSTDGTGDLASELWGERCTVLRHPTNRGPGMAVKTGILHVLGGADDQDVLVTVEADGTSDFTILSPLLAFVRSGWDLALASPHARGGGIEGTRFHRIATSAVANILCRTLLGLGKMSTYSSFYRVHRIDLLRRLEQHYGENLIEEPGFGYAVEMLTKLVRLGARVAEVPMILDGKKRIGESRMRVLPTTLAYLRLFRRLGRVRKT